MKNLWFLILILNLIPVFVFGQSDYYATDSTKVIGIELVEGRAMLNSRVCQVRNGEEIIEYTASEIVEYGFASGQVYVGREIQLEWSTEKVFLERVVKGEISLYFYKDIGVEKFFLEKDSSFFIELPKYAENSEELVFKEILQDITSDCSLARNVTELVRYNKRSIAKYIISYNSCKFNLENKGTSNKFFDANSSSEFLAFPSLRYGPILSFGGSKLILSSSIGTDYYLSQLEYNYKSTLNVGLFIDKPIFDSDFSAHIEFYYSEYRYSASKWIEEDNKDVDFVVNKSMINLPILFRYTYPLDKIRPFVNIGGVYTYNVKNDNSLSVASFSSDTDTIEIDYLIESTLISSSQFGYSGGLGVEYKIGANNALFFELRYTKLSGLSKTAPINSSEIQFFISLNI